MQQNLKEENIEYWRWQEYHRVFSEKKWNNKNLITAGVDVGSVGSKAVIMIDGEGNPRRAGDVGLGGDFLEVGFLGNFHREEGMVKNIECDRDFG